MSNKYATDVYKTVLNVGYQGPLTNEVNFNEAVQQGAKNAQFTQLVNYLTNELRVLTNIDECVNVISAPEDSVAFLMELSSFLKELGCPYTSLTQGHVTDRMPNDVDRLLLLDYLCSELMGARILRELKPEKKIELKLQESSHAADLRKVLQVLGFSKPPPNITIETLMQKLMPSIKTVAGKAGKDLIGKPMFNLTLTKNQWDKLHSVIAELDKEYMVRREMLLKRLDCTIQSFQWSDKAKGKDDLIEKIYADKRKLLKAEPDVDVSDLIQARDDLAIIEKISTASVRKNTKTAINQVIIGQVPDRGGRTSEQAPPAPEMPSWQQRKAGPSAGGGRGARGRGDKQGQSNPRGRGNRSGASNMSFDSAGSYGEGSSYNQAGNNFNRSGGNNMPFDSAGSYQGGRNNYNRGGNRGGRGSNNYNRDNWDGSSSYGGGYSDYQEPKRPRTYDQFQHDRNSYADQYVQESWNNQQYHSKQYRRGGRGGQSNYNQGGNYQ